MKNKTVKVSVSETGSTVVSVNGACGSECKDLTRSLEVALGSPVHSEKTAEYSAPAAVKGKVTNAAR